LNPRVEGELGGTNNLPWYGNTLVPFFHRCVIDQFGVNISEEELLCIVDLINPSTIEIWKVKKKFIQFKEFVLQNFDD
jgi:hypothetical protein